MLNWRDTRNPEGGGSERYVESVAARLVQRGHRVTVFCAAHAQAPADEVRAGVRYIRRGGKLSLYPQAMARLLLKRFGRVDVVVDVQNGVPYLSPLVTRRPVVVLVHHVHREQWPVVYGRVAATAGWWLESRIAPWVYRRCQYIAVSDATRGELVSLGVQQERISVVHNGLEPVPPGSEGVRSVRPRICVLGRLVPHKRVEHAFEVVRRLRPAYPGLQLVVIGDGWWRDRLIEEAARLEDPGLVRFTGHLDDRHKHAELAGCWLMLLPSMKEGWGLAAMEAAEHGVPTVAYASAGGVRESIVGGVTGLLVPDDIDALTAAAGQLLTDRELRERLGAAACERSRGFTWDATASSFETVIVDAVSGKRHSDDDPAQRAQSPSGQRLP
jgi:glycosyltransferase involved in cell wall biosynthesis